MEWPSGKVIYIFFFLNFLIVIGGIVFIVIGAKILSGENRIPNFEGFSYGGFGIGLGVIIFIIAFLGSWAAIRESGWMLITYATILIILMIIQNSLAAFLFVSVHALDLNMQPDLVKKMENLFDDYYSDPASQKIVDNIQQDLKCCGSRDYWYWSDHHNKLPPSSCHKNNSMQESRFEQGCTDSFDTIIKSNLKTLAAVALACAMIGLLGSIFACVVRKRSPRS